MITSQPRRLAIWRSARCTPRPEASGSLGPITLPGHRGDRGAHPACFDTSLLQYAHSISSAAGGCGGGGRGGGHGGSRCHVVKGGRSFGCVRLNRHFSSGLSRQIQLSSGESSSSKNTKYWHLSHERVWLLLSYRILMMTPAYHSARDESILVGYASAGWVAWEILVNIQPPLELSVRIKRRTVIAADVDLDTPAHKRLPGEGEG